MDDRVDDSAALSEEPCPPIVEDTLVSLAKELALTVPPPRHDVFFGLDRRGPGVRCLELLTRHGDFRKYVFVLDVAAGLGGSSRWLASRYGCRVLALDGSPSVVAAGRRLSVRAGLASRVAGVAGRVDSVPVRDGTFTQIFSVEALPRATGLERACGELRRVLRPGSTLALQEVVHPPTAVSPAAGTRGHRTEEEILRALRHAGFIDVVSEDVTADRAETSPVVLSARDRFARMLAERLPPEARWRSAETARARLEHIVRGPGYRAVQFFARRPST